MTDRSHLSIGEVLSLLREEFPDVTISKIRFLESQGLVDPERTPSGYRKFYDHDVDRLRWILRQQRENFLPLKVIRGRLSEDSPSPPEEVLEGSSVAAGAAARTIGSSDAATTSPARPTAERPIAQRQIAELPAELPIAERPFTERPLTERPFTEPAARQVREADTAVAAHPEPAPSPVAARHLARKEPDDVRRPSSRGAAAGAEAANHEADVEADSFSADELAELCGGGRELVADLERYGLLSPQVTVAGVSYFDVSALAIARAAAGFARYGVEARHLRAWRNAAERESAMFEQVVTPLLRQRNPQARRQAAEILAELCELGGDLRAALLQSSVSAIR